MKGIWRAGLALSLTMWLIACGGGAGDGAPSPVGDEQSGTTGNGGTPPSEDSGGNNDADGAGGSTDGGNGFAQFDCTTDTAPADRDDDGLSDCDEINIYGTNPLQADTDGDGFSDRDEVVVFDANNGHTQFNPRIADLAQIAIELTSVPNIELQFQDSTQQTVTVATEHSSTDTRGVSRNWGGESSRQLEVGHTVSASSTASVSSTVEVSPTGLGGSTTFEASLTAGLSRNRTQTVGSSVNWSTNQSRENTRAFNESEEISQSTGTTFTGGTLSVTARVVNEGLVAYDLENLTLTAFLFDPARPFDLTPIRNLEFTAGDFPTTSIITNSRSAPLNFSAELSLPRARELLRDSRNLVIEPATYRLINQDDRSILLSDQEVNARTATVTVDFGRQETAASSFRVAVADGSGRRSISALDALQNVLGLSVTEGRGQWTFGDEGAPRDAFEGVLSIGPFAISTDTNSYWLGAVNSSNGALGGGRTTRFLNLLSEDYRLADIDLRAGDSLSLVYVTDADRDALPDRYEFEFGTDPQRRDTDGDSVSDAEEIYGVMTNLDSPPCDVGEQFLVTSNPLSTDTDGDGVDDGTERLACTNPSFVIGADAGVDQYVNVGQQVTLNGVVTGLFDGLPQYTWRLVSGSDIAVNGQPTRTLDGRAPVFTAPDDVSSLVFDLEISVGGEVGPADRVVIQVQQNIAQAVYVGRDASGGISTNADGSQLNPYPSIEDALARINAGDDLYVMTPMVDGQIVSYRLTNSVTVPGGTDLFGGYDNNWVRDVSARLTPLILNATQDFEAVLRYDDLATQTRLSGFSLLSQSDNASSQHDLVALSVDGTADASFIAENNRFEAMDISASSDGSRSLSGSSYAVHIANLDRLRFQNNVLVAGDGAVGTLGGNGGTGERGRAGGNARGIVGGAPGDSAFGNDVRAGIGGRGASSGGDALRGGNGGAPTRGGASAAGRGGAGGDSPGNGAMGGSGANGSYIPNPGFFDATNVRFMPGRGAHGRRGQPGAGGGGGGGGSPVYAGLIRSVNGGGGGGGGEGGSHGFGGAAGASGGGSFGLWLYQIANADIRANQIQTADGGDGGAGGQGGSGGAGGAGGSGARGESGAFGTGSTGARGGAGGRGGRGSDGGGGSGGPSIGVLVGAGVSASLANNSIRTGDGGNGGPVGSTGNGGESVAIFDANPDDGNRPRLTNNTITIGAAGLAGTSVSPGGIPGRAGCASETTCR